MENNGHHLVMGTLKDYLTGDILPDTHDQRYRQKLAALLVDGLGYDRSDIESNKEILIQAGERSGTLKVDFLIHHNDRVVMMIKYAPGSLVTRRLSNVALSRIIVPYQIPLVVTTNGEDAEVISGVSGKVVGNGLAAIPGVKDPAVSGLFDAPATLSTKRIDQASRIAYACWMDGACAVDNAFKCDNWYCYPNTDRK